MGPSKLEHCYMEEFKKTHKKHLNLELKSKIEQIDILAVNSKHAKYMLANEQGGFSPFEYRLFST